MTAARFFCRIGLVLLLALAASARAATPGLALKLNQPMGEPLARAMLARFGYGATERSLAEYARLSPSAMLQRGIRDGAMLPETVRQQLAALPSSHPTDQLWREFGPQRQQEVRRSGDAMAWRALDLGGQAMVRSVVHRRLLAMANSDNPAHESLLSFWLYHFSVHVYRGWVRWVANDYASQIETAMADDRFEPLLRASFYHLAMHSYLDNLSTVSPDSPLGRRGRSRQNENLARELLELHTLGVNGGYTQADVQALARIISGVAPPDLANPASLADGRGGFVLDPARQDDGDKTLLGQYYPAGGGRADIDRALHQLASHPATARHISHKLAVRFLADQPSEALVARMAQVFVRTQGRVSATLSVLLASTEFARSLQPPGKFREPLDYVLALSRAVCQERPILYTEPLLVALLGMGQAPFMHVSPEGYGARQSDWLSPLAMVQRVRVADNLAMQRWRLTGPSDAPQPCLIDPAALAHSLGPAAASTQAALTGLDARQQVVVRLAAPEGLWR